MFVLLANGALINSRFVAAVVPMMPAGYPPKAETRYILRMGVTGGDMIITGDDYAEIRDSLTGG